MDGITYLRSQVMDVPGCAACYEGPASFISGCVNTSTFLVQNNCTITVRNDAHYRKEVNTRLGKMAIVAPLVAITDIKGILPTNSIVFKTIEEYKQEENQVNKAAVKKISGCLIIGIVITALSILLLVSIVRWLW